MKKRILLPILMIGLLAISCKKEGCMDKEAENYSSEAKKDDGDCVYPSEKFVGTYFINENCSGIGSDTYFLTISSTGNNTVNIQSLLGGANQFTGTVSGNSITINPKSAFPDASGYIWDMDSPATGTLNGNTITLNYNIDDIYYDYNYGIVNCSATGSK